MRASSPKKSLSPKEKSSSKS